MNKVITINLNGNAYQLEEDGYAALRDYLETAGHRLGGNPDRDEILADIEQAIADKFRALLGASKTVIVSKEVQDVVAEMGPVQDPSGAPEDPAGARTAGGASPGRGPKGAPDEDAAPGSPPGQAKHLYRIREGAMVAGVCNGIAAYLGIDVTIIRILFAVSVLTFGAGVLLYVVMMFIVPTASTPGERAAAYGVPSTAEEFIRRAREGYYGGIRTFGDKKAFREWKWQFKRDMRKYRKEMRRNAQQWGHSWHEHWAQYPAAHPGSWVAGSTLGLLLTLVTILCVFSVVSLIFTGAVFGIGLPGGIPIWLGVILLIVFFKMLKWPLRSMYHGIHPAGYGGPFSCLWNTLAWVALIFFIVWFSNHHHRQVHDALDQVRHEAHRAVDSISDWWDQQ